MITYDRKLFTVKERFSILGWFFTALACILIAWAGIVIVGYSAIKGLDILLIGC